MAYHYAYDYIESPIADPSEANTSNVAPRDIDEITANWSPSDGLMDPDELMDLNSILDTTGSLNTTGSSNATDPTRNADFMNGASASSGNLSHPTRPPLILAHPIRPHDAVVLTGPMKSCKKPSGLV